MCCVSVGGFTLIEMLVAVAILAMLVVLVAQMVGSVASGTAASGKHISADDEARLVFDRMAGDFSGMITRPDVNPLWVPKVGNDEIYFYSEAPAAYASTGTVSQVALIGYRVTTNGLERLGQGQSWDELLFTNGSVSTSGVIAANYSAIAPSVFRMEHTLLMKPGSVNNNGTTNGANYYSQTNNLGKSMQDVAGVVVVLGILDQASQKIVKSGVMTDSALLTQFLDSTSTGVPVGSWITNARTMSVTGLPAAARAQIRVYQRYFPLNW